MDWLPVPDCHVLTSPHGRRRLTGVTASTLPHRPRGGLVPFVAIQPRSGVPLYEQIYAAVREQIVRGVLRAGGRLLSTRHLAAELAVSRFTVVTALERLIAE